MMVRRAGCFIEVTRPQRAQKQKKITWYAVWMLIAKTSNIICIKNRVNMYFVQFYVDDEDVNDH
jgi:hypothetical protein